MTSQPKEKSTGSRNTGGGGHGHLNGTISRQHEPERPNGVLGHAHGANLGSPMGQRQTPTRKQPTLGNEQPKQNPGQYQQPNGLGGQPHLAGQPHLSGQPFHSNALPNYGNRNDAVSGATAGIQRLGTMVTLSTVNADQLQSSLFGRNSVEHLRILDQSQ